MMVVLLMLLLAGTLAQEDLGGKAFIFHRLTSTSYVILRPEVKKPLERLSVCLRMYTGLTRAYALFSLATPEADNAFLLSQHTSKFYKVSVNQEDNYFEIDPQTLDVTHTCVTWDSGTGLIQLWINGKPYPRRASSKGFTIGADTSIVLGQDQESYGGRFDPDKSFVGEMSDVHMWDHVLTSEDVKRVMYRDHPGNLINWNSLHYEMKGEVLLEPKLQYKHWGSTGSSCLP